MSKKKTKPSAVDQAFSSSDKHTLSDLKLEPWTPDRIIQAQEMGMLYPALSKEDWAQYRRTKIYPGAVKDVMIFVFLSVQLEEDVEMATWSEAKAFGIKRGLHNTQGVEFWDAYDKFIQVQNEIQTSATKPKGSGPPDDDEGND